MIPFCSKSFGPVIYQETGRRDGRGRGSDTILEIH